MNQVKEKSGLCVYILAKNEEANIARCFDALSKYEIPVTLFDSGSTDRTLKIASTYKAVDVVAYEYANHCKAYNQICTTVKQGMEYAMILDADMVVTDELINEIYSLMSIGHWDVIVAPVVMCVEGKTLSSGSLYPPKPIVFKIGSPFFVPVGHGEALVKGCRIARTRAKLIHDDRKGYDIYLMSQVRYARNLRLRGNHGKISFKDRIRLHSPLMMVIAPLFSYFFKLGVLSGRSGLIYAMDRLIAEAIWYRESLSDRK